MKDTFPKYIDNRPIGKDQFEGKAHDRIAKSISSHIKNKNDLRIIGIEGEWGSGKSNIIELIKTELEGSHHIYIYDSWGHQEDSHRRAFLEELTENLIDGEIIDNETSYEDLSGKKEKITWQEKIKYLLSRKRKSQKKTIPKISIGIVIIVLVIILSPIFTLISEIIFDEKAEWWVKLILPLFPLFAAICIYIYFSFKKKAPINLSEVFYLYKGKELENTTIEIFSDSEPSVKEFKNWMQSISDGLTKGLVIVFDNMDRLPPEKVKGLWSSIHTFFAEHKYNKIHIIIPFDRSHLKRAFSKEEIMTNEFINKTFSITYRVSPPVLTDWKDFFTTKFEDAFGEEVEGFSTVISVFDRLKKKFTPRDIIVFINELVTYKSIWKDEIPLKYIALFILNKEKILDKPQQVILSNDFLDSAKNLFIDDDDLQNYISALAFNVPIDKASQVLLIRDLELALRNNSQIEINELAKHNHFIEILEAVIFNSEYEVGTAIPALHNLDISIIKGKRIKNRLTNIWDELTAKQCIVEIKELIFEDNFKSLLKNASTGSQRKLIAYLSNCYMNLENIEGRKYFKCFKEFDEFILNAKINQKLDQYIEINTVQPEVFIDYLAAAKSNYKKYKLASDPIALDNYLSEKITSEIATIPEEVDFKLIKEEYSFDATLEQIETLISENSLNAENFVKIIRIYKSISEEKPLDNIISTDNLYSLLQNVTEDTQGYNELIAIRLTYANTYNQKIQPKGWRDNTTQYIQKTDAEIANEIASQIEYYKNYGDLLLNAITWNQPLLNAVCRELTLNSSGISKLNIVTVLPKFEDIIKTIDVSEEEMLKRLDGWSQYAIKNVSIDNIEEVLPDYLFYEHTTAYSLKITEHLNKTIKEYINSVEEQTLISEWYDDDSYVYNSLYILMDSSKIRSLPRNIFNSIKQVLIKISESEIELPEEDTIWSFFIEKSVKKDIAPTIRGIRDYFINNGNISSEQFIFFEHFLEKFGKLIDKPGDVTRAILGKVVSNNECFNLISSKQDFYIPIINNANEDAADFKDYIYDRLESNQENEDLGKFAEKIGVRIRPDEEAEEES